VKNKINEPEKIMELWYQLMMISVQVTHRLSICMNFLFFSHLKIDRYFISNVDKIESKQSILKSIIPVSKYVEELIAIAEGAN
jgi:predicted signal transduction protein with EAL and GGDEF domain